MPVLELKDVAKEYRQGRVRVQALRGINFRVDQGEFLSIAGPSGSGKTTLLNLVGCLDVPTEGSIRLEGRELSQQTKTQLAETRREKLGFIFQSYNLIPVLTAFENVAFPLELMRHLSRREIRERVEQIMEEVDLVEHMHRRPSELSGGQQQRTAIARALVKEPAMVLADEPTANLDSDNGGAILSLMWQLNQEKGTTFLFSTHDPMVMEYACRLVTLRDGQITEDERRNGHVPGSA